MPPNIISYRLCRLARPRNDVVSYNDIIFFAKISKTHLLNKKFQVQIIIFQIIAVSLHVKTRHLR